MNPETFFEEQRRKAITQSQQFGQKSTQFGWFRTAFFLIWVYGLYWALTSQTIAVLGGIFLVGVLVFSLLISAHNRINYQRDFFKGIQDLNKDEIRMSKGNFDDKEDGVRFLVKDHSFALDLDIFGKSSLYQRVDRTSLIPSKEKLATWLTNLASKKEAIRRQTAIQYLQQHMTWVQSFLITIQLGLGKKQQDTKHEIEFMKVSNAQRAWSYVLACFPLPLFVLWIMGGISGSYLLLAMIINSVFLGVFQKRLFKTGLDISNSVRLIGTYAKGLQEIKMMAQQNPEWEREHELTNSALKEVNKLSRLSHYLDARSNMFYWMFNAMFLLDVHLLSRVGRWYHQNSESLPEWLDLVHEMEVLCSMTSFTFQNPNYTFPELEEGSDKIKASSLGHPLMSGDECEVNDFEKGVEQVVLITGSNMAGKSTFLRTVGINVVMAWVGLPVCADQMKVGQFNLWTCMRTTDDLSESKSSFYAELFRLQGLLKKIDESSLPVLYFLDEILKGTNSQDRHDGAKGLIAKLIPTASYGFISTHDLELSDFYEQDPKIRNASFNSDLVGDDLQFDYRLTAGKCRSTNASVLMKKMGLN
ncbi:MAG: hypothetical protein JXQ90_21910 [Cyclobacteriaceae bacterium]